jgi:hypothetical protein
LEIVGRVVGNLDVVNVLAARIGHRQRAQRLDAFRHVGLVGIVAGQRRRNRLHIDNSVFVAQRIDRQHHCHEFIKRD